MKVGPRFKHKDKIEEILRLVGLGMPERQICHMLGVGKGTVNRAKRSQPLQSPLTS